MSYTRTEVANLAMAHLGDRVIEDIDDVYNVDAQVMKEYYDHARDLVLQSHDWKWSRRSYQLQQKPVGPATRYDYAYAMPPSFQRLCNVSEYETMEPELDDWEIADGEFITNAGSVFMDYVASNWSEAKWPAYFAECVGVKLAELACGRITHNFTNKAGLRQRFERETLPYARSIDGQLQPARKRFIRSPWAAARHGARLTRARPDIT